LLFIICSSLSFEKETNSSTILWWLLSLLSISIEKKEDVVGGQEVALVSIKDNGTGIDPDIFPRLFEKFA
jgi:signal transduction histidine kinase